MLNLFVVLVGTFALAIVLIYFIARHDKVLQKKLHNSAKADPAEILSFREFSKICVDICEGLKLIITDITQTEMSEVNIRAHSKDPITKVEYLIVGFYCPQAQAIEAQKIMEISDHIVSERLSKGIIMTNGMIDHSLKNLPELAPLEFIDRTRLLALAKELTLK